MNQHRLPSDVIGLSKVMPPLSRRGFMTGSAATAAGYTLAAGPVRADVIKTDTTGLKAGMPRWSGRRNAGLLRPARQRRQPAGHPRRHGNFGLHEWVKDVTRRVGQPALSRSRRTIISVQQGSI